MILLIAMSAISRLSSVYAQCTISNVRVTPCYLDKNGASKATLSFKVDWTYNAAGYADVTISNAAGNVTRRLFDGTWIIPYNQPPVTTANQTFVNPQEVSVEFPASGAGGTISAGFYNNSNVLQFSATSVAYTTPSACLGTVCATGGLGGVVFQDYNANGVQNIITSGTGVKSGETEGAAGVAVKVTDAAGSIYTTTTDVYGVYTFATTLAYPARVEFTNIPAAFKSTASPHGANNGTAVQFVTAASCTVNLGVSKASTYSNLDATIFTPKYVNGNPLGGGTSGTDAALVGTALNAAGTGFTGTVTNWATAAQTGATWGVSYNRFTKKLFSTSVVRRHVGFGSQGVGGIYVTNTAGTPGSATTNFINLTAAPYSLSLGTLTDNSARGLPVNKGISTTTGAGASRDVTAFSGVGKMGLGGLAISDNGDSLFTINLNTKELVILNIAAYNANGTTLPTGATSITIPNPSCSNATEWRPWAIKYFDGKLYVGGVCSGQASSKTNMYATVYRWDGGTTFTQILNFPLTYPKGYPFSDYPSATGWYPWTDTFSDLNSLTKTAAGVLSSNLVYPQPILTDLAFDIDGSMLLGFADRTGFQSGVSNFSPITTDNKLYTCYNGGDVLKAFAKGGAFVVENAGQAGPFVGYSALNYQGPGNGEFFNDDWLFGTSKYHTEAAAGGLAIRLGSGQTISTSIDPQDAVAWASGFRLLNNSTGLRDDAVSVYSTGATGASDPTSGNMGKAAGLGDIEIASAAPTYIEIGNRVWSDANNNGVQDPTETGIASAAVRLYSRTGTLVGITTTDATGNYFFSQTNVDTLGVTAAGAATVAFSGLSAFRTYYIVIGNGASPQFNTTTNQLLVGTKTYILSPANAATGANADEIDSDGTIASGVNAAFNGFPYQQVTAGAAATTTTSFDFGFLSICPTAAIAASPSVLCNGATATFTASGGGTYLWSTGASTTSITGGAGTYTVTVTSSAPGGCTASATIAIGMTTTPYNVCLNNSVPSGQGLTASSATPCSGAQTVTISVPITISTTPNDGTSSGTAAIFGAGTMPALPTGAVITAASLTIPNMTIVAGSGSYQNEVRVDIRLNGTLASAGVAGTGALASSASPFNYTRTIANAALPITGGAITLGYWESANDVIGAADAGFPQNATSAISITYTFTPVLQWFTAASGGSAIGTGATFNPVGIAGSGVANTTTASNTTFYAACSADPTCRTAAVFTVAPVVATITTGSATVCSGATTLITASGGGTYAWAGGATAAARTVGAGTYTVTVTNGTCTSTSSITITTTTVTAGITGMTTTCNGGTTMLTATGGGTYAWASGITTAQFTTAAGTFTVTVTNSGCTSTAQTTVTDNTVTPAITGTTMITLGSSTTLTATGGGTYAWSTSASTAAITVSPITNTTYTVMVTNGGCSSSTSVTVTVSATPIVSISGTVFNDANGLVGDAIVNGTGTNAGGTLYANLISSGGVVLQSIVLPSSGAFTFLGVTQNTNFTVIVATSATATTPSLPAGFVNTGENIGTGAGNDGTPNGSIAVSTVTTDIVDVNFGVNERPTATTATAASVPNPTGTSSVTVPAATFGGADVNGTVASITLTAFPSNATSITVDGVSYTAASFPFGGINIPTNASGVPTQVITVDPIDGPVTVVFSFTTTDNAGATSSATGTASQPFSGCTGAANAGVTTRI